MIVAAGIALHLIDASANGRGMREIHRCSFDGQDLSGRNQSRVDGSVAVGVEIEDVTQDIVAAIHVEVAVIGQIHGSRLVGAGHVFDLEFVVIGQLVDEFNGEIAGESSIAVGTHVGETHG